MNDSMIDEPHNSARRGFVAGAPAQAQDASREAPKLGKAVTSIINAASVNAYEAREKPSYSTGQVFAAVGGRGGP